MPVPTVRREDDGFVIYSKNDGTDYWRLARACIAENIDQGELLQAPPGKKPPIRIERDGVEAVLTPIAYRNPKRMVFRLEAAGRVFILKRAYMGSIGLRRLFPRLQGTTYFTRVMKMVNTAVGAGCRSTQDYYLVAEKWLSALRQEIWILLEYVEGDSLGLHPDLASRKGALELAVTDLLRHDLTLDDLTLHNFVDSGTAIYGIDISCRPFTALQKAKMRLKMRRRYGLNLQPATLTEKALEGMLAVRYRLRKMLGGKDI